MCISFLGGTSSCCCLGYWVTGLVPVSIMILSMANRGYVLVVSMAALSDPPFLLKFVCLPEIQPHTDFKYCLGHRVTDLPHTADRNITLLQHWLSPRLANTCCPASMTCGHFMVSKELYHTLSPFDQPLKVEGLGERSTWGGPIYVSLSYTDCEREWVYFVFEQWHHSLWTQWQIQCTRYNSTSGISITII